MSRKTELALLVCLLLACCPASLKADTRRPPNIIFIFVDDQGYYDLEFDCLYLLH